MWLKCGSLHYNILSQNISLGKIQRSFHDYTPSVADQRESQFWQLHSKSCANQKPTDSSCQVHCNVLSASCMFPAVGDERNHFQRSSDQCSYYSVSLSLSSLSLAQCVVVFFVVTGSSVSNRHMSLPFRKQFFISLSVN